MKIYVVYRIVNFIDSKIYVGKTCNIAHRRNEHFSTLKHGRHRNIHLQRAYSKQAGKGFYFEVIERDIPAHLINERESYWIAHFNSFDNGYNQTKGGEDNNTRGLICYWNNQEFESIADAARANNITLSTMLHRLNQGWTCDNDMPIKGMRIYWNNISYKSINEAARENNIPLTTIHRWLRLGYCSDNDVAAFDTRCFWNEVPYKSARQAAIANNIHPTKMQEWIRKGYQRDTDTPRYRNDHTCDDDIR